MSLFVEVAMVDVVRIEERKKQEVEVLRKKQEEVEEKRYVLANYREIDNCK